MLDEKITGKMRDRKRTFLHYSLNEWMSLNNDIKIILLKLNTAQEEKGKIFQKCFKLK